MAATPNFDRKEPWNTVNGRKKRGSVAYLRLGVQLRRAGIRSRAELMVVIGLIEGVLTTESGGN